MGGRSRLRPRAVGPWSWGLSLATIAFVPSCRLARSSQGLPREAGQPGLGDAYAAADLVAYPSRIEGFGNALLEAFFYRCPVLVNRYEIYVRDIAPTGVECIEIDGWLTDDAVAASRRVIDDPASWADAAERNYEIGLRFFSYALVRQRFLPLLG